MSALYDIDALSKLENTEIQKLRKLSVRFFDLAQEELAGYIAQVTAQIQELQEAKNQELIVANIMVFFDASFGYLCQQRNSLNSELLFFLRIINHVPILESSPFYTQTLDMLSRQFRKDPSIIKTFDKLQSLYLFEELEYYDGAQHLMQELDRLIPISNLNLYTLYQLCRFRLLKESNDLELRMELALNLLHQVYHIEGPASTIYIILKWLSSVRWLKTHEIYKALLYNLFEQLRGNPGLNSATVAFELFELSTRLVDPESKLKLYQELVEYPPNLLNAKQLRALYFFAGNYMSGNKERFRESIHSFKSSNYYLHKCWERLVEISKYVRTHCTPNVFKTSVLYLEKQFIQLSHYTSIRNNCYVENLQASFDEIESLYREKEQLSLTDSLTGLKNRRYQELNLPQLIYFGARQGTYICFAMLDIDLFKRVNDSYSHAAGDIVLKELADMMQREFRKSDIIIRYGGEEFLIILFGSDADNAAMILDYFRKAVQERVFVFEEQEIRITVSIGYACKFFSNRNFDPNINSYIEASDQALLLAKKSGRNAIRNYASCVQNDT